MITYFSKPFNAMTMISTTYNQSQTKTKFAKASKSIQNGILCCFIIYREVQRIMSTIQQFRNYGFQ